MPRSCKRASGGSCGQEADAGQDDGHGRDDEDAENREESLERVIVDVAREGLGVGSELSLELGEAKAMEEGGEVVDGGQEEMFVLRLEDGGYDFFLNGRL